MSVLLKVTAFVVRPSPAGADLLLFRHPYAGVQIPGGSVDEGEAPRHAVLREVAEETGLTFVENAILKARNAASHSGLPAIADDSGLEVDALMGAPGIYSARYAGEDASDAQNLQHLLTEMRDIPDDKRTARFQCVMVYMAHAGDPTPLICQGTWEGSILRGPRGDHGFGYDPVFYVPERDCSSAELDPEAKNSLSHRAKAMQCLVEKLSLK